MSSEVKGQLVTFTCDICDDEYYASGSFKDVWEAAKEAGWRTFPDDDGEWNHRCPDCRGK